MVIKYVFIFNYKTEPESLTTSYLYYSLAEKCPYWRLDRARSPEKRDPIRPYNLTRRDLKAVEVG